MPNVAVKIGKAKSTRIMAHKAVHENTGNFIMVMPGQRILRMVTAKLTPDSKLPIPDICSAQI